MSIIKLSQKIRSLNALFFILSMALLFMGDLFTPQYMSCALLYIPLMLVTSLVYIKHLSLSMAIATTILTAIAPFLKAEEWLFSTFVTNRVLTIVGIWTSFLAARINSFMNEHNNALWKQTSIGLLLVNKKGIIQQSSPAVQSILGYSPDDLEGRSLELLIPKHLRGQHEQHRNKYQKKPQTRSMGSGMDLFGLHKSGKEVPVEISLSPYETDYDQYVLAFIVDNTVRKNQLKEIEELNAALEVKVQERTQALQETVAELENEIRARQAAQSQVQKALIRERELNEMKSSFVSMASHEFRTPLTTIASSAELIGMYNQKGDLEKINKHAARIKGTVENLNSILGDFLSLGKLEEGRIAANFGEVDITQIAEDIREELKHQTRPGQTVAYQHEGAPQFTSDGNLLKNVLLNLVYNAIKYSPEDTPIAIRTRLTDTQATIEVADQGIGISPEEQQQLFTKFFRASNVGNVKGTGLGLYIVKNYVEMLNGTIECESEVGKGSVFRVTLPTV